jgi:hypothetical protein
LSIISEATVINSLATGSRTIIFNPGSQEPLTADEFELAVINSGQDYAWIHLEARPHVQEMVAKIKKLKLVLSLLVRTYAEEEIAKQFPTERE